MTSTQEEHEVTLQQPIVARFKAAIGQQELAHAYLLVGPSGAGKTQLAQWVAMRLFCLHVDDHGNPDGTCEECQRIKHRIHPDVIMVAPDGRQIKVDQIRFLKSEFSKSAVEGNQKVFIVQEADKMTTSAANSLLKFLEEPTSSFVAFLITTNKGAILPTVQSRTQVIEFPPLPLAEFKQLLSANGIDREVIDVASGLTNSLEMVQQWMENDWLKQAQAAVLDWYRLVAIGDMRAFIAVGQQIMPVADNRDHQQTILDMLMLVWRDTMMSVNQNTERVSFKMAARTIEQIGQKYSGAVITGAAQLTLQTRRALDQNIGFQNIVEELTIKIINELSGGSEV